MPGEVEIYGKDTWPYTTAAREDYGRKGFEVRYFNVKKDGAAMRRFLDLSLGDRRVPLIREQERVIVGFGGAWAV